MSKKEFYWLATGLLLTLIFFLPIVNGEFLNWDDPAYIIDNPLIKNLSFEGIKNIFITGEVVGTYSPLVLLSLAIDYNIWGLNPSMFHITNLVIHIIVVVLVFLFTKLLSKNNIIAFITALLFGIHPMHVEAVSWVSARKDLLYSMFFVAGLIVYYLYVSKNQSYKKPYLYVACYLLFIMSLLSKGTAIVFPIILLLIDFFKKRNEFKKIILEKVPFFLLSIYFFIIAITMQSKEGAMGIRGFNSWIDSLSVGFYGYFIYLIKSIIPYNLSPYHPYPNGQGVPNPWYFYLAAVPVLLLFSYIVWKLKKKRHLAFGFGFFFICLIPVIQVLPFGTAVIAERYTYLPYLGLFFLIGFWINNLCQNYIKRRVQVYTAFCLFVIILGGLTFQYTNKFKNSETFWSHVIEKYPNDYLGYLNRSNHRLRLGQYNLALQDASAAIEINQNKPLLWYNRALTYKRLNKNNLALNDLNKTLQLDNKFISGYMNRGIIYGETKEVHKAIADFTKVIELDPNRYLGYYNRALHLKNIGAYEKALKDINKVLSLNQNLIAQSYFIRAELQINFGKIDKAIVDYSNVINLDPDMIESFTKRGTLYIEKGNLEKAINDFNMVLKLDENNYEAFINRGFIFMNQSKLNETLLDFEKAKEINAADEKIYYNMAILFQFQKKYQQALEEIKMCLKLNPDYAPAIETQKQIIDAMQ
ncbi:tetratricopeptide repeat protein [Lacinutrix sp. Bg11-31]|uniref:tetratricopeptide repeat protein n=1 Tax=Lacinutrix sp. Bg11-31 TaxID=2057808 RepID=UPI000C30A6C1|nr:tetratricopeptide repeat protein [Lacinutrix sp. Bg11-31]AUC81698.1 hypothetical protein CW733_05955 [Lacinutrix sp. Bg11-31]